MSDFLLCNKQTNLAPTLESRICRPPCSRGPALAVASQSRALMVLVVANIWACGGFSPASQVEGHVPDLLLIRSTSHDPTLSRIETDEQLQGPIQISRPKHARLRRWLRTHVLGSQRCSTGRCLRPFSGMSTSGENEERMPCSSLDPLVRHRGFLPASLLLAACSSVGRCCSVSGPTQGGPEAVPSDAIPHIRCATTCPWLLGLLLCEDVSSR